MLKKTVKQFKMGDIVEQIPKGRLVFNDWIVLGESHDKKGMRVARANLSIVDGKLVMTEEPMFFSFESTTEFLWKTNLSF